MEIELKRTFPEVHCCAPVRFYDTTFEPFAAPFLPPYCSVLLFHCISTISFVLLGFLALPHCSLIFHFALSVVFGYFVQSRSNQNAEHWSLATMFKPVDQCCRMRDALRGDRIAQRKAMVNHALNALHPARALTRFLLSFCPAYGVFATCRGYVTIASIIMNSTSIIPALCFPHRVIV